MAEFTGQILGLIALALVLVIVATTLVALLKPEALPIIVKLTRDVIHRLLKSYDDSNMKARKRKNDEDGGKP